MARGACAIIRWRRGVAQLGRALVSGARGREFKSPRPDHCLCGYGGSPEGGRLLFSWLSAVTLPIQPRRLLAALLIAAAAASTATGEETLRVRVLLSYFSSRQAVTVSGDALQYQRADGSWAPTPQPAITLPPAGPLPQDSRSPLVLCVPDGTLTVSQGSRKRSYRGHLCVTVSASGLTMVNDVGLEDYLRGVLPAEMPASFPVEALKAQAVAARSYTLANTGRHTSSGADICDSDHCQVYGGAGREHSATDTAIAATAGQVLAVSGKVISAQYSSNCGGYTSPSGALGAAGAIPDTDSKGVPYCACDRGQAWQCRATQAQILAAAGERRKTPIRRLTVTERDVSGRVRQVRLTHDYGETTLSANTLRLALGLSRMKSLLCTFAADPANGDILISGRGWGHGAGLCQWGARGMAMPPLSASFRDILSHYFPSAKLALIAGEAAGQPPTSLRPSP